MLKLVRLLLVVLGATCAACTSITPYYYYRPWQNWFSPPPHTYYSASRTRHHTKGEHWRVGHNHHPPARNSTITTVATDSEEDAKPAAPAPVLASNPRATLSLAGDSMDRTRAEQTLEAVRTKLERVHARRLTKAEEETYNRAYQLAGRAQQALGDNDCAAASSLAAKASSLASGLRGSEL